MATWKEILVNDILNPYKFKHFHFNKYILPLFKRGKYHISYDYKHRALWFRTYKVASRTIDEGLKADCTPWQYIYGSQMNYLPRMFKRYFKFAFVRNPEERLISAWKDKIMVYNYFHFPEEEYERMKDFEYFLSWVETLNISTCDEHLRRQSALIDMNNIDFIGRFEHLARDFNYLAKKLNLQVEELAHLNATPKRVVELTPDQRRRIFEIYRLDFEIFYPNHHETL